MVKKNEKKKKWEQQTLSFLHENAGVIGETLENFEAIDYIYIFVYLCTRTDGDRLQKKKKNIFIVTDVS